MEITDEKINQLMIEIEKVRRRKIVDYRSFKDFNLIDPYNNINKTIVSNNNLIIGRRGCGKTSLLLKTISEVKDVLPVIIDCQPIKNEKKSNLVSKVIIRILDGILSEFDSKLIIEFNDNYRKVFRFYKPFNKFLKKNKPLIKRKESFETLKKILIELKAQATKLTDLPDTITYQIKYSEDNKAAKSQSTSSKGKLELSAQSKIDLLSNTLNNTIAASAMLETELKKSTSVDSVQQIQGESSKIVKKEDVIRDLFIETLSIVFNSYSELFEKRIFLILDDFYLIEVSNQPYFIQFFHDLYKLSYNNSFCFKMSVLPYRLKANTDNNYDFSFKDDFSPIKLDIDLSDLESLRDYLIKIICSINPDINLTSPEILTLFNNPDVVIYTILAAGGIPRDFMIIFSDLINHARAEKNISITKEYVYEIVKRLKDDKEQNIEFDSDLPAEIIRNAIEQLSTSFLNENKTNVFLYPQDLAKRDEALLRNLINLRYIHLIKEGVSSELQKSKSFDAYLVDMTFYATGKRMKRDFEFREFWLKDEKQRLNQLRRSPIWSFPQNS